MANKKVAVWRPDAVTVVLGVILGYAAFRQGGMLAGDWNACLLGLGVTVAAFRLCARRQEPGSALSGWVRWPLILLPCYAALQLVPLPLAAMRMLSPARAELQEALAGAAEVVGFAPLSVAPVATLEHLLRIAAYVLVFLLVRQAAERPWAAASPILIIAALEAALGAWQWKTGVGVSGTYANRNHFAGLLEMALPFAVMYAVAVMRRARPPQRTPLRPALIACGMLAAAALLLVGVVYSLSRMGFVAVLLSLAVMGVAALTAGRRHAVRWAVAGAAALVVAAFIFLPPDQLIARFAALAETEEISADTRVQIWRETIQLIAAYPVFGCGLGGYESAFLPYKTVAPLNTVDYTHNDYLQGVAELGAVGFAAVAALLAAVLLRAARRASHPDPDQRYLALACMGAMAAILIHSLVDFNLHIPANAMVFAWVCGLAAAARGRRHFAEAWRPAGGVVVLDVEPA